MRTHAEEIFNNYLPNEKLKDEQWKAIEYLLNGERVLVVQPTGWGKSVVYFIAAKLFREQNKGLTIIISPLLSLIRNQIDAARQMGLNAFTLNSDNQEEWDIVNSAISNDNCDVLIVAPERLQSDSFRNHTLPLIESKSGVGLIVIDEAHCISDWGHDFRPKYKKIVQFVNTLKKQIPMLATTATANQRVANDIKEQLGDSLKVIRGRLGRNNLKLKVVGAKNSNEKLGWLAQHLKNGNLEGSGIIYCTTQKETERVARWLEYNGILAEYYHGGIRDTTQKESIEQKLINNEIKVVVATIALGMGFDKKDVRFVIHYNMSTSLITYYQEIGRAGRDGEEAEIVLLYCENDIDFLEKMLKSGITSERDYNNILDIITDSPASIYEIMNQYNLPKSQLEKIIDLLEAENLIYKDVESKKYNRSVNLNQLSLIKNKNILDSKNQELNLMKSYSILSDECLMNYLITNLGEEQVIKCGVCMNCLETDSMLFKVDIAFVNDAESYLKEQALIISSKAQWPSGGVGDLRGKIAANHQFKEGRALSLYIKEGIGEIVIKNRYEDKNLSEELVDYCVEFIKENFEALNSPEWLTAVPSIRNPDLVPSFVERVSAKLGIPYKQVIVKSKDTEEQKFMKNANKQVENIKDSFELNVSNLSGRVLLIDDIMNSGWTFVVCAKKLNEAGCESVTPLALSKV